MTVSGNLNSTAFTLVCPDCGTELLQRPEGFSCPACGRAWPTREGVAGFADGDRYWGEDPRPELRGMLEDIGRKGWDEAVHRELAGRDRDAYRRIFDPRRADWFYLCDVARRRVALDLGAGWGGVSLRLAKLFDHVIAVEPVWERARFAAALFREEALSNVTTVHAHLGSLPFGPETFDLVVVNDGFERAAAWGNEPDSDAAQRELLATAARLLRPGGVICLGARNNCAPGQVLGRLRGRRSPTGLTRSAAGYRRLLEGAGFADVESYAAFPSHHHPRMLVPLADGSKLAWATELSLARRAGRLSRPEQLAHRLSSLPSFARLACYLSDSLVTFARRPAATPDAATEPATPPREQSLPRQLESRIIAEWNGIGLTGPSPSAISVVQLSGNWERGGKVNWFVFPSQGRQPVLVAKIARTTPDAERLRHEHDTMLWLRSLNRELSGHIPEALALWEINGHLVSLQQAGGYPPLSGALPGGRAGVAVVGALELCCPFLAEIGLATRADLPDGAVHPWLEHLIGEARLAAESPRYPPLTQRLFSGLARLAEEGQQQRCAPFAVVHHGDMSAGDFLTRGHDFRVIDWEWAVREGLPFIDLVHMAVSAASASGPAAIAATMQALIGPPGAPSEPLRKVGELARAYCASLGLSEQARRPLAAAALLNLMVRMPDSRLSLLQLTLPSEQVPVIAAAKALVEQCRE